MKTENNKEKMLRELSWETIIYGDKNQQASRTNNTENIILVY